MESFNYLQGGGRYNEAGIPDAEGLQDVLKAMSLFFDEEEVDNFFKITSAILHLGEVASTLTLILMFAITLAYVFVLKYILILTSMAIIGSFRQHQPG